VNRAWSALLGLDPSVAIRAHTGKIPGRSAVEAAAMLAQDRIALSGSADKAIADDVVSLGNGERRHLHTIKRPLLDGRGAIAGLVAVSVDVTAERVAEERLRASEDRFRTIVQSAYDGIVTIDERGTIETVNPAAEAIFGYSAAELAGRNVNVLMPQPYHSAHDGYLDSYVRSGLAKIIGKGREVVGRRKDGVTFPMDLTVSEIRSGERRLFAGVVRDISERRRAEDQLRTSERALLQSQKMEALGALTSGVAHEFNNTLQIISGYVELVLSEIGQGHPSQQDVLEIQKGVQRSAALTKQLLAFSREHGFQPEALDLNALAQDARQLLRTMVAANIELRVTSANGACKVLADRSMIEQVLVNLAVNARDAMPAGGRMEIDVDSLDCDEAFCSLHGWARPGRYGMLRFSDTGVGIAPDVLERIFDPFFTTKEQGKGTGLGLSMVYGIVKQHKGMIRVESEPNAGTTFRIFLPAV